MQFPILANWLANLRRQTFDNPPVTLWFGVCELHLTSSSTEVSLRQVKEISKAMSAPLLSGQKPDAAGKAFPR